MSTNPLANIPEKALVRFIALLDDDENDNDSDANDDNSNEQQAGVTMNCAQAASLSKLVADQAAATEWEEEEQQESNNNNQNDDDNNNSHTQKDDKQQPAPEVLIPVPVGTTENLKAIVRYLTARLASPQREIPAPLVGPLEEAVDDCDKAFLNSLTSPRKDVIALSSIAHYLNIPTLRDLMCALLASQLSTMNVEQMRTVLGVSNDFSNQEMNVLKKEFGLMEEHQWKSSGSGSVESK